MANSSINELVFLVACSVMLVICQGAPASYNMQPNWNDDNNVPASAAILPPVTSCDPATGKCWDWLPAIEPRPGDAYAIATDEEDLELSRGQLIHARNVDQVTDSWQEVPRYGVPESRNGAGVIPMNGNQINGRIAKKDVFMSRSWGAGGIPFSVLYMSPRNHSLTGSSPSGEGKGASKSNDPNRKNNSPSQSANGNRLSVRNGGTGSTNSQGRRHLSIIPHLFVSYGWGPNGK